MKTSPASSPRTGCVRLFAALLAALAPAVLPASGIRTGYKDAAAVARGNAFAATADNPAAIYYNPAGLTQLEGSAFSASAYVVQLQSEHTSGLGAQTTMKRETHALPQFYYAHAPQGARYAFGLGGYVPFGLATDWPNTSGFNTIATKAELTDYAVTAVAAWRVSPTLSIGGGPVVHWVGSKLSREFSPVPGTTDFTFDGDGTAVSLNLGVRWQPDARHAFGLSYQSNYTADLTGTAAYTPAPGTFGASARFVFPEVIIFGYSYRPTPEWNFEFNAEWMNWDRFNTITITNAPMPAIPLVLNWRSSFFWDFGVTRTLANGLRMSAGYTYAENSTPNATYLPAVPDTDRHLFAAGVGGEWRGLDLQLTLQYGFAETRTVSGSPAGLFGQTADGIYRGRTYALALSVARRF
jgi:long-chain fatty acid transport protein